MSEVYTPWGCCEELALLAHLAALRDLVKKTGEKSSQVVCGGAVRSAPRPPKRARRGQSTCACDSPGLISYTCIQVWWRGDRIRTQGARICGLGLSGATTLPAAHRMGSPMASR